MRSFSPLEMSADYAEIKALMGRGGFAPCIPRKARIIVKGGDEEGGNAYQSSFIGIRPQSARPLTAQLIKDREKPRISQQSDPQSSPQPSLVDCKAAGVNKVELVLREEVRGQESRPGSRKAGWVQAYEQDAGLSYGYLRPKSQKYTRFLHKNAENCKELAIIRKPDAINSFTARKSPLRSSRFRTVKPQQADLSPRPPHLSLLPPSYHSQRPNAMPVPVIRHSNTPSLLRPSPRFLTPAPRRPSPQRLAYSPY